MKPIDTTILPPEPTLSLWRQVVERLHELEGTHSVSSAIVRNDHATAMFERDAIVVYTRNRALQIRNDTEYPPHERQIRTECLLALANDVARQEHHK